MDHFMLGKSWESHFCGKQSDFKTPHCSFINRALRTEVNCRLTFRIINNIVC